MLIAAIAALAAAACFATASVLQQSAAQQTPVARSSRPILLIDLIRNPRWLRGLVASAGGFGLQGLALHLGGLALVQPLILTDLLFALPFATRLRRRIVRPRQWIAAAAIAAGLALFLVAAKPHGGHPNAPLMSWALLAGAVALSVGLCLSVTRFASGLVKAALLATCAGIMFGLLAAILDSAAYILAHNGVGAALTTWQPYLLAVVAPTGEVFAQSAFQAGPLSASLPILSTVEPSTAIAIAIIVFGERISDTPAALGAEAIALLAVVMGVLTLDRSSLLPSRCDQQDHPMAEDFPQQRVA